MLRRTLLTGLAAAAAISFAGTAAQAQAWKAKYPELVLAAIPDENASGMTGRFEKFVEYLSRELGTKVTLRVANDYAAVIEGQKAGNVHIAKYGPASYARAAMTGVKTEPFAMEVNADGTAGYHSVFYVRADSPYRSIEDLKGKNIGLVDPNSTSGNNVPRFALDKMKIDTEKYFGRLVYTGSHENAIIALQQGTVDVAANWWNDEKESNLKRMERKGMAKYSDFRIIYKSDQIVNSPFAYLSDLPAELKTAIRDAFFAVEKKDPEAFRKLTDGQQQLWKPTTHKDYEPIVELNRFVDDMRKRRAS
ncbi:phosphonate transport system substrate-binding protein [Stella humosa]|uniref:Phosphonate transport system substrate-binding protein n=1 Tax=Stella humosa TaxID=94 RepID=A0A3N1KUZ9_9PROT|nr:phosphonate ABC transporter substrate-binding protein [Stella humosa]ROP83804.1 phosphonate transport system substrate-binding protein [Stella humosa]BBK32935.1 phosphonate ABC transporter substrate-binding protein [Stella humosa]